VARALRGALTMAKDINISLYRQAARLTDPPVTTPSGAAM
jgi:hypothetical protein